MCYDDDEIEVFSIGDPPDGILVYDIGTVYPWCPYNDPRMSQWKNVVVIRDGRCAIIKQDGVNYWSWWI